MLLSYIITTCNRQHLVTQAIASVMAERCPDSELILVDDGSRPAVQLPAAAINAFGGQIRLIRHDESQGVIRARNAGIRAARGRYVLFLDDDDTSLPNRSTDLLAAIEDTDFAFVAARSVMHTGPIEKVVPAAGGFMLQPLTLLLYPPHINAVIWRRGLLTDAGGLDNRVPYLGEHITMMLWLLQGQTAWLSPPTVARFGYLTAGLTDTTVRAAAMKEQLLPFYQILLAAGADPSFQDCCRQVIQLLQERHLATFDAYLTCLQPLIIPYLHRKPVPKPLY